ncbi:hypothetical protein CIB95_12650 [Lottiidibacillus patelloidae]|uniref:ABC transporter permease n=1 Tax=Lottiidibacillus patelloidae TaxID=2670334 RepID=A0A263BSB7_9BACI|nr:ABC transporter permease subunit [Lottiidibacillus patelloidae]OZM56267.1 hypothetical protein CIB95_12650 [Lottiidibacillus patelloidae]
MFNRFLWKKHYKQSKFLIWTFIFVSLFYPINIYFQIGRLQSELQLVPITGHHYYFNASYWISIIQILCLVLLATIFQGRERSNQSIDFALSLPLKRKDILLSKWSFGVVTIVAVNVLTMLITTPLVYYSILSNYLPLHTIFLYFFASTITLIGIYTLCLLVGQIVGNQYTQLFASAILLLFPFFFWILAYMGFMVHYENLFDITKITFHFEGLILSLMFTTTMPVFLVNLDLGAMLTANTPVREEPFRFFLKALFTPALITVLYLSLIGLFSKKVNSENNGKLLVYKQLNKIIKIAIVLCSYLIGGWVFAGFIFEKTAPVLFYHAGGIIFASITYFVIWMRNRKK